MRTLANVVTAMAIAFMYGAAGGLAASYAQPDPLDSWVVTREYGE